MKDQAEADEDTNWQQRVAIGVGEYITVRTERLF